MTKIPVQPIIFDNGYLSQKYGQVLEISPPQQASDPFIVAAVSAPFSGDANRSDFVVVIGHNVNPLGTRINTAHGAVWDQWEQYYAQDGLHHFMERHLIFDYPGGVSGVSNGRWLTAQYAFESNQTHIIMNGTDFSFLDLSGNQWLKVQAGSIGLIGNISITHNKNNYGMLSQLNAEGSQYVELIRLDGSDNVVLNAATNANGVKIAGTKLGLFGTAPVVKPTVTGSKGANAALTSLMSSLASIGLVTDSTT